MSRSDPRSTRELFEALADTPLDAETRKPELLRQRIYRQLADHDDPLLREIGEQLRDGVMRPHQLLTVPGYDEVIDRGLERLRGMNSEQVRAALISYLDSATRERDRKR